MKSLEMIFFFQSSGQKSLLEYFSPSNKKSEHNDTLTKGMKRKSETTGMLKVPSNECGNLSSDVIVIDGKPAAVFQLVNVNKIVIYMKISYQNPSFVASLSNTFRQHGR